MFGNSVCIFCSLLRLVLITLAVTTTAWGEGLLGATPPSSVPVLEGGRVELECSAAPGAPALTFSWQLNGTPISDTTRRYVTRTLRTSSLVVLRAHRVRDAGSITCEARARDGAAERSEPSVLDVMWLENPRVELEEPISEADIVLGSKVTLMCDADVGNGDIKYHWYRNGERLTETILNKLQFEVNKDRLVLPKVGPKENGVYGCSLHLEGDSRESKKHFVLKVLAEGYPRIEQISPDLLLAPKSKATFHCKYSDNEPVEWYKSDLTTPLENTDRISIDKDGGLEIVNVTRRDEGFYSCVAYGAAQGVAQVTQRYGAKLKVAVIKPLTIWDLEPPLPASRVVWAKQNTTFQLSCVNNRDNVPPALLMWKNKDGHLISDQGAIRVDDGRLIIDKTTPAHRGVYTCLSENIAGVQEITFYLLVNPTPKFLKHPKAITISENEPSQFRCEYSAPSIDNLYADLKQYWGRALTAGYLKFLAKKHVYSEDGRTTEKVGLNAGVHEEPAIDKATLISRWLNDFGYDQLRWKKDDRLVKEEQGRLSLSKPGVLTIERTMASDKGTYWCELHTTSGFIYHSHRATLTVIEILKFSPPPVSKKLELNSPGKIHCKVQGTPTPNVTWFKNVSDALPDDVQSWNGTLTFVHVERHHATNYTCVAESTQGRIQHTIRVDVVVSPRFVFPLPGQTVEVSEGEPVWLDCVAQGDPEPRTQWDRNLQIIQTAPPEYSEEVNGTQMDGDAINRGEGLGDNRRIFLLKNGTLHVRAARSEDADKYGCTAGNSAGLKREEVTLLVHPNGMYAGMDKSGGVIGKAVVVAVGVAAAYMLLVVGLMLWCRHRRRRKCAAHHQANDKVEMGELEPNGDGQNEKLIDSDPTNEHTDNGTKSKNKCNGSTGPKPKNGYLKKSEEGTGGESGTAKSDNSELSVKSVGSKRGGAYDKLVMPRTVLYDMVQLGRGEFGEVFAAKLDLTKLKSQNSDKDVSTTNLTIAENQNDTLEATRRKKLVMIKSLTQTKDESCLAEFKRHLDMFSKLKHENVARVIGLCNEAEPHYLVFEYTDWGDLKRFLESTRTPAETKAYRDKMKLPLENLDEVVQSIPELSLVQMLRVAHQICKAMEYISDNRMVHRDLACRNCVVWSHLGVRVSMPCLTKDPYSVEYCRHRNLLLPLRWLPAECVHDSDYSTKSDAYMYACTVWEIFHKGDLPFVKLSDNKVLTHLKNKTLQWTTHEAMPQQLVQLLEQCWSYSPKDRPTFDIITKTLGEILENVENQPSEQLEPTL